MTDSYSVSPDGKWVALARPWDSSTVDSIRWFTAEEWEARNKEKQPTENRTPMTEPICFYIREEPYGFLSNFERAPQVENGLSYPTNEHYYQAQKASDPTLRAWIRNAPTAWHAMKAGRALKERETTPHWSGGQDTESNSAPVKLEVMLRGLRLKFSQNPHLAEQLLATGDAALHESPKGGFKDSFWGNTPKDDGSPGDSHLGRLLMQVREELRSGELPQATPAYARLD